MPIVYLYLCPKRNAKPSHIPEIKIKLSVKIYQGTFLFVSELIQCESFSYDAHLAPARIITHKQFKNWGFISFCHGMYAGQSDRSICC